MSIFIEPPPPAVAGYSLPKTAYRVRRLRCVLGAWDCFSRVLVSRRVLFFVLITILLEGLS